ncbi:MAG TPA: PH domain-containing protein [Methanomassiliicoccales archaeon]|nr:PH domain-containing protein [Methanomassiliicoccales archaeon]
MAREFDVNENGITVDGFKKLHPKVKSAMRVGILIFLALSAMALVLAWFFAEDPLRGAYWPLMFLLMAIVIIAVLDLIIVPTVFYARYRYNVGEDRIDVLRGVLVIRHMVVPIERIHQVEVTRGPVKNMFGLADVTITTAGGTATIEYLELPEAEGIADRLNEKVLRIIRERD